MIQTENLCKIFRTEEVETSALTNVNLHIKKGEFVAIMGPSGCGKSTLLNIIGLLDNPSRGKFTFINQEISTFTERQRSQLRKSNIGFVFQSFNLIDELSVYENVELPWFIKKFHLQKENEKYRKFSNEFKWIIVANTTQNNFREDSNKE